MYISTLLFLNIGTPELMAIMFVVILLFGGKKLPELARGLGKGIREFKDASDGVKREIHRNINSVNEEMNFENIGTTTNSASDNQSDGFQTSNDQTNPPDGDLALNDPAIDEFQTEADIADGTTGTTTNKKSIKNKTTRKAKVSKKNSII
ncbi:MAG TPA: twin-arginine translocase TatA/TatE family subunit [Sphingobacteriaceae bacterium]|nr:twin-arginine translocase TatA/TatE family subunit [Sphingobacteriaceae bacterium]